MNRRAGFSLIEILVAMVLLGLVLLLLFRGVQAVGETVTGGQRRSELHRQLATARRVLRDDVEAMVQHPRWRVGVGEMDGTTPPMLAFLRYREGSGGTNATEWVQYRVEPHPDEDRLFRLVRVSGAADDREAVMNPNWWEEVNPTDAEVVLDHLVEAEVELRTSDGIRLYSGPVVDAEVEAVDVRLACTVPPLFVVPDPADTFLERMRQEDGDWIEFRLRPGFRTLPPGEVGL